MNPSRSTPSCTRAPGAGRAPTLTRPGRLALLLACLLATQGSAFAQKPAASAGAEPAAAGRQAELPADVQDVVRWVSRSRDHGDAPFLVVDKRRAALLVFGPDARLLARAPVLLGAAKGDDSVPGIGERKLADIKPHERTTPAGRFVAEAGRNLQGEDIVWIDYDAAVSMHRVRATNPKERRLERLATASVADNRISFGCINVPARFFDAYVSPVFAGGHEAIVYVLPDTKSLEQVFPAAAAAGAP